MHSPFRGLGGRRWTDNRPEVGAGQGGRRRGVAVGQDPEAGAQDVPPRSEAVHRGTPAHRGKEGDCCRMTAIPMDGRALSASLEQRLKAAAEKMKASGTEPMLATILVGDDQASRVYVASKHRAAGRVGIGSRSYVLLEQAKEDELASLIAGLNADRSVNGILLQLPLPPQFDELRMLERIDPEKDVDGLTATNAGRLVYGRADLVPCTPRGIMELLHHYGIPIRSSRAVIINRSTLVGKPLHHLLLAEDATVTVCHSKSTELPSLTQQADILVTAVGRRPTSW